jgi:hypothetical protein
MRQGVISSCTPLVSENELRASFPGQRIPEGVFSCGINPVSVEVKRMSAAGRQTRDHWRCVILSCLDKAHADLVRTHGITAHNIVFCVKNERAVRYAYSEGRRLLTQLFPASACALGGGQVRFFAVVAPDTVF